MPSHIGSSAGSDDVGVGGPMDDGDVAVLVRAELMRWWVAQKSGHEGQDPIEDDGTRSDGNLQQWGIDGSRVELRGDALSKSIKLEVLGLLDAAQDREQRMNSPSQVCVLQSDGVDLGSFVHNQAGGKGCAPPGCEYAHEAASFALGEIGPAIQGEVTRDSIRQGGLDDVLGVDNAGAGSSSLQVCTPSSLDAAGSCEKTELVPFAPLKGMGTSSDEKCIGSEDGIVIAGIEGSSSLSKGGSPARDMLILDSTEPVCSNADEVVEPVAAPLQPLDHEFLPPAPGVGLQEWVRVAKDYRKGNKMKGANSAAAMGLLGAQVVGGVAVPPSTDPFPPLSRKPSGFAGSRGMAWVPVSSFGSDNKIGDRLVAVPRRGADDSASLGGGDNLGCTDGVLASAGNNFSWSALLRSSKPVDLGVDLHFVDPTIIDGEQCAVFSVEEEAENMKCWQHTLMCYVVGMSPTYFKFLKTVNRLWRTSGEFEVFSRENGIFYCRFSCEEDVCRVIKDGPWYMDGKLVVVKKFVGDTNSEEKMLSCIPIWVKLPNLPLQWWSISGVSKVVSPIGHPLYFDIPSADQRRIAYARCCVEVTMDKALPEWVTCVGGDKVKRRQKIEYDWVPKKCSKCNEFGHLAVDCRKEVYKVDSKNSGVTDHRKQWKGNAPNDKNQHLGTGNLKGTSRVTDQGDKALNQSMLKTGMDLSPNIAVGKSAATANVFHPLRDIVDDPGELVGNRLKGKHTYFCSDDEDRHTCGGSFQPLLNIEEEVPDEVRDVDLNGESLGIHLEDDVPVVQHNREGEAEADIEDEGRGKEQVAETNMDDTHGMVDKIGVSFATRWEGDSEENDSGNQGENDSTIMEDSDYAKSNKKKKRIRKKPAPTRPEGSRTTRHSGNIPKMNE